MAPAWLELAIDLPTIACTVVVPWKFDTTSAFVKSGAWQPEG